MDRRDSELQTRQGEGPETMSMLDSSEPATTGNEDDDKALANMNIKRSIPVLMTFQEMHVHIMGLTSAKIGLSRMASTITAISSRPYCMRCFTPCTPL